MTNEQKKADDSTTAADQEADDQKRPNEPKETPASKIVVGVSIALIAAAVTYLASSIDHLRTARLAYVNQQIEKLYGPLYALTQANNEAWNYFTTRYFPGRDPIFSDSYPPFEDKDIDVWRLWIKTVFQPLNVKIESAIVDNSQLLMGGELPPVFRQLITHTESYKSLIATWKNSDRKDHGKYIARDSNVGAFNYPANLIPCVKASYEELRNRKARLESIRDMEDTFGPEPGPPCECTTPVATKCPQYVKPQYVLPKPDDAPNGASGPQSASAAVPPE